MQTFNKSMQKAYVPHALRFRASTAKTAITAKTKISLKAMVTLFPKKRGEIVEFQGLVYGNNLDVVAVTETWLHNGYFDGEILSSSLYTVFRKDRGGNKRGGGVLLAVKTDLLAHRRPDLEPPNSEILVCDFVSPNSFKITFCLCYRPPSCSLFMDYFECLLVNLRETTGRICIVGDFNMPTIDW